MTYNFRGAATRHHIDAKDLHARGRRANAGHLYGLAAECVLKAFLEQEGVNVAARGKWWTHIEELWDESLLYMKTRHAAKAYAAKLTRPNPFAEWHVAHRYCKEDDIPLHALPDWEYGSKFVVKLLQTAELDGYFTT